MSVIQSGHVTVTTAGAAERMPVIATTGTGNNWIIQALAANTGIVYIGDDGAGDVASTNGFELQAGFAVTINSQSLDHLWIDVSVSGEGVCWIKT